jgi:3-hydroxy acid dehydrogenase / malonic semialdehyde reductase
VNDVYKGFEPLHGDDVAEAIYYMASRPEHINIADMVITCAAQATSSIVLKG